MYGAKKACYKCHISTHQPIFNPIDLYVLRPILYSISNTQLSISSNWFIASALFSGSSYRKVFQYILFPHLSWHLPVLHLQANFLISVKGIIQGELRWWIYSCPIQKIRVLIDAFDNQSVGLVNGPVQLWLQEYATWKENTDTHNQNTIFLLISAAITLLLCPFFIQKWVPRHQIRMKEYCFAWIKKHFTNPFIGFK